MKHWIKTKENYIFNPVVNMEVIRERKSSIF